MQFLGKFGKSYVGVSTPGELAPPPRGNPGSAIAFDIPTIDWGFDLFVATDNYTL